MPCRSRPRAGSWPCARTVRAAKSRSPSTTKDRACPPISWRTSFPASIRIAHRPTVPLAKTPALASAFPAKSSPPTAAQSGRATLRMATAQFQVTPTSPPRSGTGARRASAARALPSACPRQTWRRSGEHSLGDEAELVHGTCVALGRGAALLRGPPGSGKSDLALRFLYLARRGPAALEAPLLVADDQVRLARAGAHSGHGARDHSWQDRSARHRHRRGQIRG